MCKSEDHYIHINFISYYSLLYSLRRLYVLCLYILTHISFCVYIHISQIVKTLFPQLYVYTACSATSLLVEKEMICLRKISMCSDIFIRISRSISFDE